MRRTTKTAVTVLMAVLLILMLIVSFSGVATASQTQSIEDLAEAVAYWQEQAILAAIERDKVMDELARITAERDMLLADRATLEDIVTRLQSERNDAIHNAKSEALLRQQLEIALMKLAGPPRFSLIIGATYEPRSRDPALLAAMQWTLK